MSLNACILCWAETSELLRSLLMDMSVPDPTLALLLFHELPNAAIRNVIKRGRPRCIPGTNKYARVCRSWREASSSMVDDEQLQLYLDLDKIEQRELDACVAWLQQHGSCATGLTVEGLGLLSRWLSIEQALFSPSVFSSNITRLDLKDANLLALAPHLQQLPTLQHLGTHASCVTAADPWQLCHGDDVAEVPNLGLLCPQLVSLHLVAQPHDSSDSSDEHHVHPQLVRLLPRSLQRLHLEGYKFRWDGSHFTHLSALGHMTLDVLMLVNDG